MPTNKLYFKNLDSIRFIAAFMVFMYHAIPDEWFAKKGSFFYVFLSNVICNGQQGVSIFFVLSGFLITYLLITEHEKNGKIVLRNFYIRRVLRIWPLYYAVVFFGFVIYPLIKNQLGIAPTPNHANVLYYLTFLSNFDILNVERHFKVSNEILFQVITWSVSVEEQFYLFWPLIFVFLPKKFWLFAVSTIIIISFGHRIINNDSPLRVNYLHTIAVLIDLGLGGLVAYLIKTNTKVKEWFESVSTRGHVLFMAFYLSMLLWGDYIFTFQYAQALSRVLISVSLVFIIASQAMTKKDSILNLGNFPFISKWGKYTYGIYLIHPIALFLISCFARYKHISVTTLWGLIIWCVLCFCLTLLMSWISYEYFESKFLALKNKFTIIETRA